LKDSFQGFVKSYLLFFSLSSGRGGVEAWTGVVVPDVVGCCISSGLWLYYRKYCFSDRVPKTSFSSFELLKEAKVITLSTVVRETTLHDLPLSLGLLDSYCSSLTISGGPT